MAGSNYGLMAGCKRPLTRPVNKGLKDKEEEEEKEVGRPFESKLVQS